MGFEQLIDKVAQAERALELDERRAVVMTQRLKRQWKESWTPGRIVVAGLASGFLVGRAQPLRATSGGGVLQMLTALGGLFAGGSAQVAAEEAAQAAASAEQAALDTPPSIAAVDPLPTQAPDMAALSDRWRRSGAL